MRAEPYGRPQAVDSYESEGAVVFFLIGSDEYSFHESRVGVEVERTRFAGFRICACSAEGEIGLTDNASKVGDRGRIAATGMCTSGICRREVHARHRTREEEVTCIRREYVRNRQGRNAIICSALARVCSSRHPNAGSQHKA